MDLQAAQYHVVPYHSQARLSKKFYTRSVLEVAETLIGVKLVTSVNGHITSGIITEVEAYDGSRDEAAHSFRGKTPRASVMFEEGGLCYVYFIYGVHYCVNVVAGKAGHGSAALIRSVYPVATGPGRVCKAFNIDQRMYGENLISSNLIWLETGEKIPSQYIERTPRIGISKAVDLPWRFNVSNASLNKVFNLERMKNKDKVLRSSAAKI